jgi:hypothetical protein
MWDKFSEVLNLGDAWADEDGRGEWVFSTGTRVSVRFKMLEDMDELEIILDMFEDSTDEEKAGLRSSLNQEGYVSYFQYTVITQSEQEYIFNQLIGGGGEPVVEDFYCEEDAIKDIADSLDKIIFLRTDELWGNPNRVINGIAKFLNVQNLKIYNKSTYVAPEIKIIQQINFNEDNYLFLDILMNIYKKDIEEVQEKTGLNLTDWLERNYCEVIINEKNTFLS